MTVKQRCITLSRSLAIAVVTVMLAGTALAQTETVLHNFQGNSDGATPMSGLVADKAGNLYGTTHFGGGSNALCGAGCGTVFELTPPSGTEWPRACTSSGPSIRKSMRVLCRT